MITHHKSFLNTRRIAGMPSDIWTVVIGASRMEQRHSRCPDGFRCKGSRCRAETGKTERIREWRKDHPRVETHSA